MRKFYIILPTRYGSVEDLRFKLFLRTIKNINNHSYVTNVIVVDSSHEDVYKSIETNVKCEKMVLLDQKNKRMLKAGSIREGISYVIDNFGKDNVICFQDPEKENMIYHYCEILDNLKNYSICIPERTSISFDTYPKEQYFSENFMNIYLNRLTKSDFDYSFGPILFTGYKADYWLNYDGKLHDGQIVPLIGAIKNKEKVLSYKVSFMYPVEQKKEEEGNLEFIEKRRYQLNYIVDGVMKYMSKVTKMSD